MKILQVAASMASRYGGPPVAVEDMSRELASRGHEVEVLSTDVGISQRVSQTTVEVRDGVRYVVAPARHLDRYVFSIPLLRELSARVPSATVVHIHSLYLFHTLAGGILARVRKVPYVISPHGALDEYHWSDGRWRKALYEAVFERRAFERAAVIHCCTEREHFFASQRWLVRGTPCEVVPLGVRVPASPESRRSLDRKAIVFLGRITAKKRLDLVVTAFLRVASRFPDLELIVAGPDDEGIASRIRRDIARDGARERIQWLGPVDRRKKTSLLREAHAFVLPSEDESFGVAAVEAMAAGVPVIVSTEVAVSREIEGSGAGLVVERNVPALASALEQLLQNPELHTSLSRAGIALAARQFAVEAMGEGFEGLYARAVERRRMNLGAVATL